ncbi:BQ5605_C004g02847 [Microbotryum silenes-dioicae]|uniref:BQ5605_C004g02847 protein n=1 Tax=Microbotryum silenes-dioicae TaxID=796604 RepID=A0A2X0MD36_9BASI|nr:BQ5605_C004g02847 [Microbotryum silenes-dioicae]
MPPQPPDPPDTPDHPSVADALGRCLGFLAPAQWKALDPNQTRWATLGFMAILYSLCEDGGNSTGRRARSLPSREIFRRVSDGKDVDRFSYVSMRGVISLRVDVWT